MSEQLVNVLKGEEVELYKYDVMDKHSQLYLLVNHFHHHYSIDQLLLLLYNTNHLIANNIRTIIHLLSTKQNAVMAPLIQRYYLYSLP